MTALRLPLVTPEAALDPFDLLEVRHFAIPGPGGRLEVILEGSTTAPPWAPVAVIGHPHPLQGGNLHNKVAHILARGSRDQGSHSLRFNFRGTGNSEGCHDNGRGEQQDVLAVVNFVRQRFPAAPLWMAGFSFGSAMVLATHRTAGASRLLLVAPPVDRGYFPREESPSLPWGILMGRQDELVDPALVEQWANQQSNPPILCWSEDASHLFHGRLGWLRTTLAMVWPAV